MGWRWWGEEFAECGLRCVAFEGKFSAGWEGYYQLALEAEGNEEGSHWGSPG
jgi:hypothetical protein